MHGSKLYHIFALKNVVITTIIIVHTGPPTILYLVAHTVISDIIKDSWQNVC